jgi:UDP-GlcNAc:undecaprenyl-phosphate GlcNAc-1-phosphate transferase
VNLISVFLSSFALCVPLVILARIVALRWGVVDTPRAARASQTPRPYLGGVAVALAVIVSAIVAWIRTGTLQASMIAVLVAVTLSGLIGLSDDLFAHTATPKLIAECGVATLVVALGGTLAITEVPLIDAVFSLLAIVLLMNSFNLLDNSDGALASVAVVTGLGITGVAYSLNRLPESYLAMAVAGASLALLLFNWHPASIFMGDAGSLFVGCALVSSLALLKGTDTPRSIPVALGLMLVPLVDTMLVFIARRREGRPFMAGGVDHLHHRLGRTTVGVRGGAALLAAVSAVGSSIAVGVTTDVLGWLVALIAILALAGALLLVGLRLPSRPQPSSVAAQGLQA